MLIVSRRTDESIEIQPGADLNMTLAQLFSNGPILIMYWAEPAAVSRWVSKRPNNSQPDAQMGA
jgi:hypothetical protein